jgi:hypothetical protein
VPFKFNLRHYTEGCVLALSGMDISDDKLLFAATWGLLRFTTVRLTALYKLNPVYP